MKILPKIVLLLVLALPLILAACTSTPVAVSSTPAPTQPVAETDSPTQEEQPTKPASASIPEIEGLAREDAQGNVAVVITPLNLDQPGETLDFDVKMDTHSVDLSMDLAVLATLTTDAGKSVSPVQWDAPMGGHHVAGTLSFPASIDGSFLFDGATTLTLTLRDVDVPERIFTWPLTTE